MSIIVSRETFFYEKHFLSGQNYRTFIKNSEILFELVLYSACGG
jgi:hypothetical protein